MGPGRAGPTDRSCATVGARPRKQSRTMTLDSKRCKPSCAIPKDHCLVARVVKTLLNSIFNSHKKKFQDIEGTNVGICIDIGKKQCISSDIGVAFCAAQGELVSRHQFSLCSSAPPSYFTFYTWIVYVEVIFFPHVFRYSPERYNPLFKSSAPLRPEFSGIPCSRLRSHGFDLSFS